jgi:hypothetical protein
MSQKVKEIDLRTVFVTVSPGIFFSGARTSGFGDDHDLHARAQSRRPRRSQSLG